MSRYENNPYYQQFLENWNNITELLSENDDSPDELDQIELEDKARFHKIFEYLNDGINSLDIKIIPNNKWQNIATHTTNCCNALKNKKYPDANAYIDNLSNDVCSFFTYTGKAAQSAAQTLYHYNKTISSELEKFVENINGISEKANNYETTIDRLQEKVDTFANDVFNGDDPLEIKVGEYFTDIEKYHARLLIDDDDDDDENQSIKSNIEKANTDIMATRKYSNETMAELSEYHTKIFGIEVENGKLEGGLKQEIEKREAHLEEFQSAQKNIIKNLQEQIRSLLPSATSAGLASAYKNRKEDSANKVKIYNKLYYWTLGFLFVAICYITHEINFDPFTIETIKINNWQTFILNISNKLPFGIIAFVLLTFVSKRRKEEARLEQEYAHKEAIAMSYQGFKTQIDVLGESEKKLSSKLLESAIDAISYNASNTLDKPETKKSTIENITKHAVEKTLEQTSKFFPKN